MSRTIGVIDLPTDLVALNSFFFDNLFIYNLTSTPSSISFPYPCTLTHLYVKMVVV